MLGRMREADHRPNQIRIRVSGIVIETDSPSAAVDVAREAARRQRAAVKRSSSVEPPLLETPADAAVPLALTAWDRFAAHLRRPDRRNQLLLLRYLQTSTEKGNYVSRVDAATVLGFDGSNGHRSIGGVVKGIVRKAKSCGLEPADAIECSTLGYRAGRLVRSNQLPEEAR